jgi:hypothetical protein
MVLSNQFEKTYFEQDKLFLRSKFSERRSQGFCVINYRILYEHLLHNY